MQLFLSSTFRSLSTKRESVIYLQHDVFSSILDSEICFQFQCINFISFWTFGFFPVCVCIINDTFLNLISSSISLGRKLFSISNVYLFFTKRKFMYEIKSLFLLKRCKIL